MLSMSMPGAEEGAAMLGGFRFALAASRWADEAEPMMVAALSRRAPVSRGPSSGRSGKPHLKDSFRPERHITPVDDKVRPDYEKAFKDANADLLAKVPAP